MESNEQPSVAVTSEVVSNNYAQQKLKHSVRRLKILNKKILSKIRNYKFFGQIKKTSMNDCGPRRGILGKIVYSF